MTWNVFIWIEPIHLIVLDLFFVVRDCSACLCLQPWFGAGDSCKGFDGRPLVPNYLPSVLFDLNKLSIVPSELIAYIIVIRNVIHINTLVLKDSFEKFNVSYLWIAFDVVIVVSTIPKINSILPLWLDNPRAIEQIMHHFYSFTVSVFDDDLLTRGFQIYVLDMALATVHMNTVFVKEHIVKIQRWNYEKWITKETLSHWSEYLIDEGAKEYHCVKQAEARKRHHRKSEIAPWEVTRVNWINLSISWMMNKVKFWPWCHDRLVLEFRFGIVPKGRIRHYCISWKRSHSCS